MALLGVKFDASLRCMTKMTTPLKPAETAWASSLMCLAPLAVGASGNLAKPSSTRVTDFTSTKQSEMFSSKMAAWVPIT